MTRRRYAMDGTLLSGPPETEEELAMRRERFAEMIRERKFPAVKTETLMFAGQHTLAQQFGGDDIGLRATVAGARRAGYEPKTTDLYNPTLARFPGDPEAFYQPQGAVAHLKRVAEKRGRVLRGAVEYDPPIHDQPEQPLYGRLAPDLVNDLLDRKAQTDPEIKTNKKKRVAAREAIVAKHALTL